tara:strand:+ start:4299 stop:4484 length:186 start_codon:yes stop_codon:yes gene_type:complete
MRNFMDKHDKEWMTEALNMLGIPNAVLNKLRDSEIQSLWSVLNRFFGDVTTADEYNKLKEG